MLLMPLWEGGGARTIELMRWTGAGYYAAWETAPNWATGTAGIAVQNDGTDAGGLEMEGSFTTFSKIKQQVPLSIEVVIQPNSPPASGGTIFANDVAGAGYTGFQLRHTAAGTVAVEICDGGGALSTNRLTWASTTTLTANQMYHIAATVRGGGAGGASMWINGRPESLSLTGTGNTTIGYSSGPAKIIGKGRSSTNGFSGRLYLLAFYNREFMDREVHLRARDPFTIIRRPLNTTRVAGPQPDSDNRENPTLFFFMGE